MNRSMAILCALSCMATHANPIKKQDDQLAQLLKNIESCQKALVVKQLENTDKHFIINNADAIGDTLLKSPCETQMLSIMLKKTSSKEFMCSYSSLKGRPLSLSLGYQSIKKIMDYTKKSMNK